MPNTLVDELLRVAVCEGSGCSDVAVTVVDVLDPDARLLARDPALLRCACSFQPSEPKEPVLMSEREGALAAVVPVAAHMPGGGFASISLPVALRSLLETVEAFVEDLSRPLVVDDSGTELDVTWLLIPGGCGNGTGVGMLLLEDAMCKREGGWSTSLVMYSL